ncbi:Glutamate receptor delta-1 subunit [Melipona quadrifasciata]|uniref:Glutamate receptor delta-1 subunit n=1 Tax=Melipona quadrifasciata TaxID=166423 RepID=A0A0N0U754_9HYME|nr:Glutamate receptor delta-1 subunit [Melipona quadrifasciata]
MLRFRREFRATLLLLCVWRSARFAVSLTDAEPVLIRPIHVYQSLIKGVHDYFNNTCVILFHGSATSMEVEGMKEMDGLLELQRYFSGSASIRTAIMDFHTFRIRIGNTYHHIKRPLFVLLNDLDEIREQFALVSKWIAMAYPTWLLFLQDETSFEEFLSDVYVPFDCMMMVTQRDAKEASEIIREVYQISREDGLRSMNFGKWDPESGFRGPRFGLYQRRHDLHGRNIRVVSINDPPVSRVIRDEIGQPFGIRGFFGEVIQLLQEGMNCTKRLFQMTRRGDFRFTYMEATSWGAQLPNGSWTGLIKMLVDDEADLGASELMMSSDRLGAIKYTTPVYTTRCRAYIKRPDTTAVNWNAYLAPFSFNIWNAIGLTIIVVGLAIAGIDAFSRKADSLPADIKPKTKSSLSVILFSVFGVFCGQGTVEELKIRSLIVTPIDIIRYSCGMEPSSLDPTRLVHLSIHLTAVVVLAAYSAALISHLAIKTFLMPFTTMEGLLEDGTYRFAVVADSADYSFFQNTSDNVLTIMFDQLLTREADLPPNYFDGLTRVCQEKKYAFMTLDNMASVLQGKVECALEPLDVIMQTTIAMAVPADSPYRGIINSNILLLRDSGILQRLIDLEWSSNERWVSYFPMSRAKSGWSTVEMEDAAPLLIFMLSAFLVTCLVLLIERLFGREQSRIVKQKSTAN